MPSSTDAHRRGEQKAQRDCWFADGTGNGSGIDSYANRRGTNCSIPTIFLSVHLLVKKLQLEEPFEFGTNGGEWGLRIGMVLREFIRAAIIAFGSYRIRLPVKRVTTESKICST